jgi:hypothetical protein
MALGAIDITLNGFGNTGGYQFATPSTTLLPQNNSRLIRRIQGSRSGVDILGVSGSTVWSGTDLTTTFGSVVMLAGVEVLRTSLQVTQLPSLINPVGPLGVTPTIQYPAGVESLWYGAISSPVVTTPTAAPTAGAGYSAAAPTINDFRFPPGTLRAFEDQQLWVVMGAPINYGFGGGSGFPGTSQSLNHFRTLSVIGVDYGKFKDSAANMVGQRSIPRSFIAG